MSTNTMKDRYALFYVLVMYIYDVFIILFYMRVFYPVDMDECD